MDKFAARVLAVVPAYNEVETIAAVAGSLLAAGVRVRVVDNGSTDGTAAAARAAGAEVVAEPQRGYGRACWRGLQHLPPDVEWILFCDGDGSDDLTQLPALFERARECDLVLGNRTATAAGRAVLSPVQRFGNRLATGMLAAGWGQRYRDLGPLRLVRRALLEQMDLRDRGFGWTVEMQARAVECGARIAEVPVRYRPRKGGRSKISGTVRGSLQAGVAILGALGWLYGRRALGPGWRQAIAGLLVLSGCGMMVPFGDFYAPDPRFWLGAGVASLGFALSWTLGHVAIGWFWVVALGARTLLLGMAPGDDIWRYIWEGLVQLRGFSPYELPPIAPDLSALRPEWWSQIVAPEVTAIYPPLAQWGFRGLAAIAPAAWLFKLAFAAADAGVCWLLARRFGATATLVYAWNPLVLYSFAGGGHYDSWFVLLLVGAWLLWERQARVGCALLLGASVAVKWVSLPLLGFVLWRSPLSRWWAIAGVAALPVVLAAVPFCGDGSCPLVPTRSNFVTVGRSAELVPFLLGLVWEGARQANWYYALPLGVVLLWLLGRSRRFEGFAEGYFLALLLLSPIVHAWYFAWLVPWAVQTRNLATRFVSLSAFVYFVLPYRKGLGDLFWLLRPWERVALWLPLLLGLGWIGWREFNAPDRRCSTEFDLG